MDFISTIKLISEVGVLIVCAGVFIALSTSLLKKQQELFVKLIEDKIKQSHPSSEDVETLDVINNKIYQELRGVLCALKADRVFCFLYHNGGVSSSGLYFQKMSCICEVVSQGILPMANKNQAIYRASYASLCDTIKSKGEYLIANVDSLKGEDNFFYQECVARHAESVYFRALKDSQDNTIGFIGIDYCSLNTTFKSEAISKLLKTVGVKISALVDIRDEVKEG